LTRIASTFGEPSHYAAYLVFVIMAMDFRETDIMLGDGSRKNRWPFIVALILTVSLTGYALYAIYRLYLWYRQSVTARRFLRIRLKWAVKPWLIIGLTACGILLVPDSIISDITKLANTRSANLVLAIVGGEIESSEGSRLNSMRMLADTWSDSAGIHMVAGVGFNNYSEYLEAKYVGTTGAFARGTVQNIFVAVGLGTGLVGLLLYLWFVFSLRPSKRQRVFGATVLGYYLVWFIYHLGTGHFILYTFFGYAYFMIWRSATSSANA
jgi:hypothetical protein